MTEMVGNALLKHVQYADHSPSFMAQCGLTEVSRSVVNPEFTIYGDLCQVVEIPLQPGQKVQCDPGAMVYMGDGCVTEVKFGGLGRLLTEGNIFKDLIHNKSSRPGFVGFTANFPASLIPINLDTMNGVIKCKHDAFLAAVDSNCEVSMSALNTASCLACCCSGAPMFVQEVKARGWVFLAGHGTMMQKMLAAGEEIIVDTHALVAMDARVTVDVVRVGSCTTMCCGGSGMFNTALKGPGLVIVSSMPLEKLRALFPRRLPPQKKKKDDDEK